MTMDYRGLAVYVHQKDPYIDAFLKRKRERFEGTPHDRCARKA